MTKGAINESLTLSLSPAVRRQGNDVCVRRLVGDLGYDLAMGFGGGDLFDVAVHVKDLDVDWADGEVGGAVALGVFFVEDDDFGSSPSTWSAPR